jgi:nickel/cobalt exporter
LQPFLLDRSLIAMSRIRLFLLLLLSATVSSTHPMGNFSVNHYSRIDLSQDGCTLTYVLDFAEIPTFQLLQQWNVDAKDVTALRLKAKDEAKNWLKDLVIRSNQIAIAPVLKSIQVNVQDGAGGMPVLRVAIVSKLSLVSGTVEYEDHNYPGRTGWKEIVIHQGRGAKVERASQSDNDLSKALTRYPIDASVTPPQDLDASIKWKAQPQLIVGAPKQDVKNPEINLHRAEPVGKPFTVQQPVASGSVVKGDFLSRLLRTRDIGLGFIVIGIAVAFGLGAMHALSPGHGKTIVAAYLVGSRGTMKHAIVLGATVTLTHTVSVFLLGIGVLCFERYIIPDRIIPWLGAFSGLSIVSIGIFLLYQRARALQASEGGHAHLYMHAHHHGHAHENHHHEHSHGDAHDHDLQHNHSHTLHLHSHGGRAHSHMPSGKITLGSLIALGVSGGLVPCPSALVLMLSAIALDHAGLGLILLVGFSCGLALVLMAVGVLVIHAKNLIPNRPAVTSHPLFRFVPVFSAVVVVCLGLGMTAVSLGWLQPGRFGI